MYVVLRGPTGEIQDHGSGTVWRVPGRGALLLTAHHVVENHSSFTLGNKHGEIRLRDATVLRAPTGDVAVVPLPRSDLDSCAFDPEELSEATTVAKGQQVMVLGYPESLKFVARDRLGEITNMSTHTYGGFAAGSSRDSLSIEWKVGESTEEQAQPFRHLGVKPGLQPLSKPTGISGGGVWLIRKQPGIWTVEGAVRFVAVPHEYVSQRQLAVPVWRWRDWLLGRLNERPLDAR